MNIAVSGPNINMSEIDFDPYVPVIKDQAAQEGKEKIDAISEINSYLNFKGNKPISYGLGTIKSISSNAILPIIDERKKNGKFNHI